ncbi:hypothetical protein E2562_017667 [Oryza meyeriana var. granulata]|uniref:Uncharacterized protein n=1 Tax=Oryza meyeriana var. granulata TaxID=110450 RepID=A0A6G1BZ80_9ORYZ|nr:hypothetical protein E2562_017667 [Oryza meyeriana var. granulata]
MDNRPWDLPDRTIGEMNLIRLARDMTHLMIVLVLLLKIHTIKSCAGFDLNLPLDEFGVVDFNYLQNLPGKNMLWRLPLKNKLKNPTEGKKCLKSSENKFIKLCWLEARMGN